MDLEEGTGVLCAVGASERLPLPHGPAWLVAGGRGRGAGSSHREQARALGPDSLRVTGWLWATCSNAREMLGRMSGTERRP